ncbi:MAG: hypothetical protein O3B82_02535, partial [Bacteroidetes bacterium]|nr:hypothetical protein [Bacteroidota bacterium]
MKPQHRPKTWSIALLCLWMFAFSTSCQNIAQKTANSQAHWPPDSSAIARIPIQTPVGEFKVWTQRFGQNHKIKILLLHGGPAMTHEYMQCFEPFFIKEQLEFYQYDQLGSYYSDQPKDSSLWTTERFVEEVEQVRKAIGADAS